MNEELIKIEYMGDDKVARASFYAADTDETYLQVILSNIRRTYWNATPRPYTVYERDLYWHHTGGNGWILKEAEAHIHKATLGSNTLRIFHWTIQEDCYISGVAMINCCIPLGVLSLRRLQLGSQSLLHMIGELPFDMISGHKIGPWEAKQGLPLSLELYNNDGKSHCIEICYTRDMQRTAALLADKRAKK